MLHESALFERKNLIYKGIHAPSLDDWGAFILDAQGRLGFVKIQELYRIPFHSDVGMLYYRKDWLKEFRYQPPETFEQLLQISKALQKQKGTRWGFVWQARQYEGLVAMFLEVLKGYGGFWIEDGKVGLDKPEALQAINFIKLSETVTSPA